MQQDQQGKPPEQAEVKLKAAAGALNEADLKVVNAKLRRASIQSNG